MKNEMSRFLKKKHKRSIRKSGFVQWLGTLPKHFRKVEKVVEPIVVENQA